MGGAMADTELDAILDDCEARDARCLATTIRYRDDQAALARLTPAEQRVVAAYAKRYPGPAMTMHLATLAALPTGDLQRRILDLDAWCENVRSGILSRPHSGWSPAAKLVFLVDIRRARKGGRNE